MSADRSSVPAYGPAVAAHYAAFRPSLHGPLLQRALGEGRFAFGVDVGSGTGVSAVALAAHCDAVVGVEPSADMRARARVHPRVRYVEGTADAVPLPDAAADAVTLAGVLSYTNTAATHAELRRIVRPGGRIVCYDFSLDLGALLRPLGLPPEDAPAGYDHAADLGGVAGFVPGGRAREPVVLDLARDQLVHVLLADGERYAALAARAGHRPVASWLADRLDARVGVPATGVWSVWHVDA